MAALEPALQRLPRTRRFSAEVAKAPERFRSRRPGFGRGRKGNRASIGLWQKTGSDFWDSGGFLERRIPGKNGNGKVPLEVREIELPSELFGFS